jgi:hypothetical protein
MKGGFCLSLKGKRRKNLSPHQTDDSLSVLDPEDTEPQWSVPQLPFPNNST